jgi:hypothetical protein
LTFIEARKPEVDPNLSEIGLVIFKRAFVLQYARPSSLSHASCAVLCKCEHTTIVICQFWAVMLLFQNLFCSTCDG